MLLALLTSQFAKFQFSFRYFGLLQVVPLVTALLIFVGLNIRAVLVRERYSTLASFNTVGAAVAMGVLWAATALPVLIVFGASALHFESAQVCETDGTSRIGLIIAEASDRLYLAELNQDAGVHSPLRRALVIPLDKVNEFFIGELAPRARCSPGPAPPVAQSPPSVGTVVFRTFGGAARVNGHFWTPADPRAFDDYRAEAELPSTNACEKLVVGQLTETSSVKVNIKEETGLIEYIIPNPSTQVADRSHYPLTPPC